MEEIKLNKERRRAFPLWVWDVYTLARKQCCGPETAFRLFWEPRAEDWPAAEYIVEATRALLLWRRLTAALPLLALLHQAGEKETFLWTALLFAEE